MIYTTKNICHTPQEHWGLCSLYLCPRVVEIVLNVEKIKIDWHETKYNFVAKYQVEMQAMKF